VNVRKLLNNWLGLSKLVVDVNSLKESAITSYTMRKEIVDALEVILDGDPQGKHRLLWNDYITGEGRRFEFTVRRIVSEEANAAARAMINEHIGNEAFLDEIVARLQRKQL
jgi:hypothetical protein